MQKLKITSFKILISFVTSVILINTSIPALVYAGEAPGPYQHLNNNNNKQIKDTAEDIAKGDTVDEVKGKVSGDLKKQLEDQLNKSYGYAYFQEYIDLMKREGADLTSMDNVDSYVQEYINEYYNYRKDLKNEIGQKMDYDKNKSKYSEFSESKFTEDYESYLDIILGDFRGTKPIEQKTKEQLEQEELEEQEYVDSVVGKDDEGFLKTDGIWDSIKRSIEKQCFQAISNIVTVIADRSNECITKTYDRWSTNSCKKEARQRIYKTKTRCKRR